MKYVFDNYFKPYINVVKECGSNKDGCWTQTKLLNNEKQFNGWIHSYGVGDGVYTFSSKDGMNINLDGWSNQHSIQYLGVKQDMPYTLSVIVDVNGNKKPNQMGRDVFVFVLTKKGLIPAGSDNDSENCTKDGIGYDCAAKVLQEGKFTY